MLVLKRCELKYPIKIIKIIATGSEAFLINLFIVK